MIPKRASNTSHLAQIFHLKIVFKQLVDWIGVLSFGSVITVGYVDKFNSNVFNIINKKF